MRRMAYLTQFWIPALLNPVINKIADEDNVLVVLTNQSYNISIRMNMFVILVLMSPVFSLAYTCACAYA